MPITTSNICITILLCFLLFVPSESSSRTFEVSFKTSWFKGSPDGVEREILGFNGEFPPYIRINKGDSIRMAIKNNIPDELIDIHHHGIFQKGTLTADGVGGITQCDPFFGKSYVYKFNTGEQTGTYLYHAHSELKLTDGIRAPFIIDDPQDPFLRPFNYYIDKKYVKIFNDKQGKVTSKLFYVDHSKIDEEIDSVIFLTDWHHTKAEVLGAWLLSPASLGNDPTPESALINNVGDYFCRNPPCVSLYSTKIVAGKAKKFRIINGSSMAVFNFAIQGHSMYIVETDGITLDGSTMVDTLRLNAGQRYSVIVKADQEPRNFWIRAVMDKTIYAAGSVSPHWQPEVYGELKYVSDRGELFTDARPSQASYRAMDAQIERSIKLGAINIDMHEPLVPFRALHPSPPKTLTKKIILNIAPVNVDDGTQYLAFNNVVYNMPIDTTVLGLILNNQPYEPTYQKDGVTWGVNSQDIKLGEVVDLIINNFDTKQHPLHGHGHSFYVMYQGATNSNDFITDPKAEYKFSYNSNASLRDTVSVNGNSILVLRFVADNPGAWVFHSQNNWNLFAGLKTTIVEDKKGIKKIYKKFLNQVSICELPIEEHRENSEYEKAIDLVDETQIEKKSNSRRQHKN